MNKPVFRRKAAGEYTCILRSCPINPSPNRTLSEFEKIDDPYAVPDTTEGPLCVLI